MFPVENREAQKRTDTKRAPAHTAKNCSVIRTIGTNSFLERFRLMSRDKKYWQATKSSIEAAAPKKVKVSNLAVTNIMHSGFDRPAPFNVKLFV